MCHFALLPFFRMKHFYCFVVNRIVIYAKYQTGKQHLHANMFSRLEKNGQFWRARVSVLKGRRLFRISLLWLFISQSHLHVDHLSTCVLDIRCLCVVTGRSPVTVVPGSQKNIWALTIMNKHMGEKKQDQWNWLWRLKNKKSLSKCCEKL